MNLLPTAIRIASKTIGLELVEVRPMPAPKGILFYMSPNIDKKEIRKSKIESLYK